MVNKGYRTAYRRSNILRELRRRRERRWPSEQALLATALCTDEQRYGAAAGFVAFVDDLGGAPGSARSAPDYGTVNAAGNDGLAC